MFLERAILSQSFTIMTTVLAKLPGREFPVTENSGIVVGYPEDRLRHLAHEIAMDIFPVEDILRANNVTEKEWLVVQDNYIFKALLQREKERWHSALSTAERVRIKALTLVEDSLLAAARVINNEAEGAQGRARMLEAVSKIANLGDKPQMAGEGGKVMIQINMGADKQLHHEVTPQVTVIEATPESEDVG